MPQDEQAIKTDWSEFTIKEKLIYSLFYILFLPVLILTLVAGFILNSHIYKALGVDFKSLAFSILLIGGIFIVCFLAPIFYQRFITKAERANLSPSLFVVAFLCLLGQLYLIFNYFGFC